MFDLNFHIHRLLQSEPFFASLSRRITKISTKEVPTAGVTTDKQTLQFIMYYNPEWFSKLTELEACDVIIHELYHLIFEHVGTRLPSDGMSKKWNIACDLAINSYLPNLPENCLLVGQEGTPWQDVPKYQTAEWYMANIPWAEWMKAAEDAQGGSGEAAQGGSGEANRGVHDYWCEGGGDEAILRERLKEIMREATNEAASSGWGSVSHKLRSEIVSGLSVKVDWRAVLRSFIRQSNRANKRSSMRRLNRRYPYIHAGRRVERTANLAISIDQSGSVSNEMLSQFFAELNGLAKIATFTVVPFDTEVSESEIYEWEKGKKYKAKRVLTGGTCFSAPTKWVNEQKKFDGHIILTDMCAPKPIASKCPRLWVTTEEFAGNPYFKTKERVIGI